MNTLENILHINFKGLVKNGWTNGSGAIFLKIHVSLAALAVADIARVCYLIRYGERTSGSHSHQHTLFMWIL